MLSRLNNELDNFLLPYDICTDSDIFVDTILKFADVPKVEKQSFNNRYAFCVLHDKDAVSEKKIGFDTPPLNFENLFKLFDLFDMPWTSFKTKKPLIISDSVLWNKILPNFMLHVEKLAAENQRALRPYQIASKAKLERASIESILRTTDKLIKKSHEAQSLTEIELSFCDILFIIKGAFSCIKNESKYYLHASRSLTRINEFVGQNPEIINDSISKDFETLRHQLKIYIHYNRADSMLAIDQFLTDLDTFLSEYHIKSKGVSDIFEHILFELAGISQRPKICDYERARDETQMRFSMIGGIDEEQANQLLDWIKSNGDETATMRANTVEESDALRPSDGMQLQCYMIKDGPVRYVEKYEFYLDGLALYKNILPQFKQAIVRMAETAPDYLAIYQTSVENKDESKENITNSGNNTALETISDVKMTSSSGEKPLVLGSMQTLFSHEKSPSNDIVTSPTQQFSLN